MVRALLIVCTQMAVRYDVGNQFVNAFSTELLRSD